MDATLRTFLVDLATDPGKLAAFASDREGYLAQFSLAPEVRAAVLAGDELAIARLAGGGDAKQQPNKQPNKMQPNKYPNKLQPKKKKPPKPPGQKKKKKKTPKSKTASKKKGAARKKRSPKRPG